MKASVIQDCRKCGKKSVPHRQFIRPSGALSAYSSCRACESKRAVSAHNARANKSEYKAWLQMHSRCSNPNYVGYHRYGGRGISVCEAWSSFEQFLKDIGPKPHADLQLDRKNNNGNYEPGNCRWASRQDQARNTSTNRVLKFQGRSMLLVEWAELLGLPQTTLDSRIHEYGWSVDRALSTPRRRRS